MVKQPSKFNIEFEFEDSHIITCTGYTKGIRHKNQRPYYATITCKTAEEDFTLDATAKEIVFKFAPFALKPPFTQKGRVILRPAWFHKIIANRWKR